MANLPQPINRSNPFAQQIGNALAPVGMFIAKIVDIRDEFGVTRLKFQSTEPEKVDLTCFLFEFQDAQGKTHRVASKQMKISGNEKSALYGFLKSLLGRAPAFGWDYCLLKGEKCLLTVEHVKRRDGSGVFAAVATLSPVPPGLGQSPPPATPMPPAHSQGPLPAPTQAPASAPPSAAPSVTASGDDIPF
jgi:hypothetical protein